MEYKKCSKCGELKELFRFNYSRPGVLRGNCKRCQREYNKDYLSRNPEKRAKFAENRKPKNREYRENRKKERNEYLKLWGKKNPDKKRAQKYRHRYGIDLQDYKRLLNEQCGKCAICGSKDLGRKGAKYFVVDHCHNTNEVRGILCHPCNMILGFSKDSLSTLNAAVRYLEDT